mgnify:CR=1 FL=1
MKNYKELCTVLIELVGGKSNIKDVLHCMTRLRFTLKDRGLAKMDEIEKTDGVLGIIKSEGELQVIIGPMVTDVYHQLVEILNIEADRPDNPALEGERKKMGIKDIGNNIINAIAGCFGPLVPIFFILGIFNTIAIIIGPNLLNIVSEESDIYTNFYWIGQAILYFLPVYIAYAASKRFKVNTLISLTIAAFMLYPSFVSLIDAGTGYTFFGIPITLVNYSASVIPIFLSVWIQSYIERIINKYLPNTLKSILEAALVVAVLLPITLIAIGPLGTWIGIALSWCLDTLNHIAGPLATTLEGATSLLGTGMGFTRPIFFAGVTTLTEQGVERIILPSCFIIQNWCTFGATAAFIIRSKTKQDKTLGITCFTSSFLGGVSEPAIYGIFFNHKKIMAATMIGGAAAGLFCGIMKVAVYYFGPSSFLGVLSAIGSGGMGNFYNACIMAGIACIVSFVLTLILYKGE